MKKTLLAIALGLAIMPLTFAQTAPANPPAGGQNEGAAPAKKHVKKHRKAKKTTTSARKAPTGAAASVAPSTHANPSK
jgi:hypothetical protein